MKILVTICARGGSKRVKNKNIRLLAGKPLIQYTIDIAKKWGKANRIVCSTDSEEIARIAQENGIDVPFIRKDSLSSDFAGKVSVIRDAFVKSEKIFGEKYDVVVDLDVTCPIRTVEDLNNCLKIFTEKSPEMLFSVTPSRKNPYFNMVELDEEGFASISKKPENEIFRTQDVPKVYSMNACIYFYSRSFLLNEDYDSVLSSPKTMIYEMNETSGVDIDNEIDFKFIEFLIRNREVEL